MQVYDTPAIIQNGNDGFRSISSRSINIFVLYTEF